MEDEVKERLRYIERKFSKEGMQNTFRNANYYAKTLGKGKSVRLNIPLCHPEHFDSLVYRIAELNSTLQSLKTQNSLSDQQRINEATIEVYRCHRQLKGDADDSSRYPRSGETDFRGAR